MIEWYIWFISGVILGMMITMGATILRGNTMSKITTFLGEK